MKHTECKDCELYNKNCGNHFEMDGVTNFDIASLSACDQYGNCMFFKSKAKPKGDLISREALKEDLFIKFGNQLPNGLLDEIDNAPTVEPFEKIGSICEENCGYNPQGKYVDISKLRLMTVEECAGHTIDYAMGWKACIEWIKKGGAE